MRVENQTAATHAPPSPERETKKQIPAKPPEKAPNPAHLGNKVDTEG